MICMWDAVWKPQPWHHITVCSHPHPNFLKIHPHLHKYYSVRVPPYVQPKHIKELKHFVYLWYGCGMKSGAVCRLNHDNTTHNTIQPHPHPNFPKIHPYLHRCNSVRVHPYVHPQHIKVLNTLYTYDMDVGCSLKLFVDSTMAPQHHSLSPTPQLSKNSPPPTVRLTVIYLPQNGCKFAVTPDALTNKFYGCKD